MTDGKDAVHLARLLQLDEFTPVSVPTVDQEAARDLVRAREDCRGDLMRARNRLSKLLLRQGIVYYGGQAWTGAHDIWLRRQRFGSPAVRMTFESGYDAVLAVKARRDRLGGAIAAMAADSEFTPQVRRLGCLRGISTRPGSRWRSRSVTGTGSPATPSAPSSAWSPASTPPASRECRDRSPKRAAHVRRLLIEAAWHHRARYLVGKMMRDRWKLASPAPRARGDAGNRRPHQRWVRFNQRCKRHVIANVAIVRELAGWCWSLAVLED